MSDMSEETQVNQPTSIDDLRVAMELRGKVKNIELFGAFLDIGVGKDALLHISQLGNPDVRNVEDVVSVGDELTVYILKVERETGRVALSMEQPPAMPWDNLAVGTVVMGTVVRMENFGVFVDIGAERPGMIHVSELASGFVNSPSDVVSVGDELRAQVIKINRKKKRIDLSVKVLEEPVQMPVEEDDEEPVMTEMEVALRRAMQASTPEPEDEYVDVVDDPMDMEVDMDDGPRRSGGGKRAKRDKRRQRQREYDDIYERTLRGHRDN
ncbi:MAG: S1 RNA-binding domain-containing protein [Chloroflexi bacterium]|nr:S1 RNA-binding domain-containing protein [Chloroflexota bacterium]